MGPPRSASDHDRGGPDRRYRDRRRHGLRLQEIHGRWRTAGQPPVIKSDDFASKTKPADAGGKQFPYSDTKIMGRLGDGTSSASADDASNSSQNSSPDNSASSTNPAIRPPMTVVHARSRPSLSAATVAFRRRRHRPRISSLHLRPVPPAFRAPPLVDVFGQEGGGRPAPASAADGPPVKPRPLNAEAPPAKKVKPVKLAKINTINSADASSGSADDNATTPRRRLRKRN